jgi:YVTN family beta-propeller protein
MTKSNFFIGLFMSLMLAGCTGKNISSNSAAAELSQRLAANTVQLPNGWKLSAAGRSLPLGDLPLNLAVSPSKKLIAATNNGMSRQTLTLIDADAEKVLDDVEIPVAWVGLAFGKDDQTLYASGGNSNRVMIYAVEQGKLRLTDSLVLGKAWPKEKISVAGIAVDVKKNLLYAVTKEDSSIYTCDLATHAVVHRTQLAAEAYTCLLSPTLPELYVSLWGGEAVSVYNTETFQVVSTIQTESHPNDMTLTKNGERLFVANANSNSVSVIDTKSRRVTETLSASLYPNAPTGSTTNGVALSDDDQTLYIANADNNCLAVFDVSKPTSASPKGFIPTAWYPTAVKIIGQKIFVANGKGLTSQPNPKGPVPTSKVREEDTQYIGSLFKGTLSIIDTPNAAEIAVYAKQVYANTPYTKDREVTAEGEVGNPIPQKLSDVGSRQSSVSPIKYVFYIIKENRTYDQVLGDVKAGNGDSSLCLFPEKISPNHHALADEFVLLDNFYVDAEVSADGHNWSDAAYATDFVEKTWPTNYGGRGGNYDFEGGRKAAYPKDGFIWDYCKRAGVSYRSYGEFVYNGKATTASLEDHFAPAYVGWNMDIKDIAREKAWEHDFDSLVAANALPRFQTIRLPNDHTNGAKLGKRTPLACMADNDLALGRLIEHLSQSPVWQASVVFVLEDDAQNGPDHVDAHRSIAFVASPFVKRHFVDHTMYSTSGMLRTMELILGLPPMSQYDAAATPMWRCFTSKPDASPYKCRDSNIDLDLKNVAMNENSRKSEELDLTREDAVPDLLFSEIIWKAVRGQKSQVPSPKHSAFVKPVAKTEEEED